MEERNGTFDGDVKMKSPFLEKLGNFWYYHKWHTLIGVFVVAVLVILTVQMCQRTTFDAHIVYAGNYEIDRVGTPGNTSAYDNMLSELKLVVKDADGDGEVHLDFKNLFVVNDKEADELTGNKDGYEINHALVREDAESLYQYMIMSEYYLCFLSERLFLEYSESQSGLFTPIAPYASADREYEYAGECGIYLRSVGDFATLPQFSNLPDDTVICLRSLSEVSKRRHEKDFKTAEDILRRILSYQK
jgi:hypothetical protein